MRYGNHSDAQKSDHECPNKTARICSETTRHVQNCLGMRITAAPIKALKSPLATASSPEKIPNKDLFQYTLVNEPVVTCKNKKRGHPSNDRPVEKVAVEQDRFRIELSFDENAFNRAARQAGYYPLVTHMAAADLSVSDAMRAHKDQYKVEHAWRRSKSGYNIFQNTGCGSPENARGTTEERRDKKHSVFPATKPDPGY